MTRRPGRPPANRKAGPRVIVSSEVDRPRNQDRAIDELTALLLAARDGDRLALGAWIRQTQGEVWSFCAHLVGRDEADDLTQDTYVRAFRSLASFRGESSARTWLFVIARRSCIESLRRMRRRKSLTALWTRVLPAGDAADAIALDDLLGAMEPDRRTAFILTQLLGFSYTEAAEVCRCPVGTIRSRVARARMVLIDDWRDQADTGGEA